MENFWFAVSILVIIGFFIAHPGAFFGLLGSAAVSIAVYFYWEKRKQSKQEALEAMKELEKEVFDITEQIKEVHTETKNIVDEYRRVFSSMSDKLISRDALKWLADRRQTLKPFADDEFEKVNDLGSFMVIGKDAPKWVEDHRQKLEPLVSKRDRAQLLNELEIANTYHSDLAKSVGGAIDEIQELSRLAKQMRDGVSKEIADDKLEVASWHDRIQKARANIDEVTNRLGLNSIANFGSPEAISAYIKQEVASVLKVAVATLNDIHERLAVLHDRCAESHTIKKPALELTEDARTCEKYANAVSGYVSRFNDLYVTAKAAEQSEQELPTWYAAALPVSPFASVTDEDIKRRAFRNYLQEGLG